MWISKKKLLGVFPCRTKKIECRESGLRFGLYLRKINRILQSKHEIYEKYSHFPNPC